ncbi:hypothetical protein DQT32_03575 [Salmonella enterica subsp. enterica serovar Braenderup]|nr:hypothetical protein [Salmonella enterica subsp. enterica serovar Braenderup]
MSMTLTVSIFDSTTFNAYQLCVLKLQYFSPEQTFDLFEHEYVKRYDVHFYKKIGEKNCRKDRHEIMYGTDGKPGFIFSFAEVIARSGNLNKNDSVIFEFKSTDEQETFIVNVHDVIADKENSSTSIIDDYDLLMQKYNDVCNIRK